MRAQRHREFGADDPLRVDADPCSDDRRPPRPRRVRVGDDNWRCSACEAPWRITYPYCLDCRRQRERAARPREQPGGDAPLAEKAVTLDYGCDDGRYVDAPA